MNVNFNLNEKCGIYIIINTVNGKRYIGSSKNIYDRLCEHKSNLKNNKGHNVHLQAAWNKYGEDKFICCAIEFCEELKRFDREQYYINCFHPEYNLTENVVANTGHIPTKECREKISKTLKRKYSSGEIITYKQDHNWKHVYLYDIYTLSLYKEYDNLANCIRDLFGNKTKHSATIEKVCNSLLKNRYIGSLQELKTRDEIANYVYKKLPYCKTPYNYLIIEKNNKMYYMRTTVDCYKYFGISRSMIFKNLNATKENPYISKKFDLKLYFTKTFIKITNAVPLEESKELLSGNIGKIPEKENPEINSEIKKSGSLYSVECETCNLYTKLGCMSSSYYCIKNKNIIIPRVSDTPTEISG